MGIEGLGVGIEERLLLFMSSPLLSKLLNSGTVCPQSLWTKMLLLYQHTLYKSSLSTFLDKVPDMPPTRQSGVNNNPLLDWARVETQFVVGVRYTQSMGLPHETS